MPGSCYWALWGFYRDLYLRQVAQQLRFSGFLSYDLRICVLKKVSLLGLRLGLKA